MGVGKGSQRSDLGPIKNGQNLDLCVLFLVSLQKENLGRGLEGLGLVKKEHKTLMSADKKDVKYNFGKDG